MDEGQKRVMVVGLGYTGRKHLQAYLKDPRAKVVSIVVASEASKARLESEFDIPVFLSVKKAIEETKPDFASICTPTPTHLPIAKECLTFGLSLLIEKPLASDEIEAQEIAKIAKKCGARVLCAHTEIFNPAITYFLRLAKTLKNISSVSIKKYGNDQSEKEAGEDYLSSLEKIHDGLIHLSYVLNSIVEGVPASVRTNILAMGVNQERFSSEFSLSSAKVKISSEYDKTHTFTKEIYVVSESGNLKYLLERGQETVLLNGAKMPIPKLPKDQYKNMISYFLSDPSSPSFPVSMRNAAGSITIASSILAAANQETDTHKAETNSSLTIRPSLKCNQKCLFCNIMFDLGFAERNFDDFKALVRSKKPGEIVLSGGEPTLQRELFEFLDFARGEGVKKINLQTNAILCADTLFCDRLKRAGVTEALVSLHSHDEAISDYLTAAPGTFGKTVAGIKNLVASGVMVRISHVLTSKNYADFKRFMEFVKEEFPGLEGVDVLLNQNRGMGKFHPELLPTLTQIEPHLLEGIAFANQNKISLINSFTIPLCFWPDQAVSLEYRLLSDESRKEAADAFRKNKTKSPKCAQCSNDAACLGVWKTYASTHGLSELRPSKTIKPVEVAR